MDQIVVVNPIFGKKLENYGIDADRITYIPNFVSKKEFYSESQDKKEKMRRKLGIPADKFTVIGVGQVKSGRASRILLNWQNVIQRFSLSGLVVFRLER